MARYVEAGTLDVGITGRDWVLENGADVAVIRDLVYSKATLRPTRWVLVAPENSPVSALRICGGRRSQPSSSSTRVAILPSARSTWTSSSRGGHEAKAAEGLVDAIVEVTETGSTLRANGLRIVCELFQSNPQLIANHGAWADPWKRDKIEQIGLLLLGALQAETQVGLKLNAPKDRLDAIVAMLPSITAPTVSNLYGKDWFSIESVIAESVVRELIPKLMKAGAVGIIEYSSTRCCSRTPHDAREQRAAFTGTHAAGTRPTSSRSASHASSPWCW